MKNFIAENWFKLGILVILLLFSMSLFYYLVIFLPHKQELAETKKEQEQLNKEQEKVNAKKEVYRKECAKTEEENTKSFEDFINTCSRGNSVDYCVDSEAGKIYAQTIGSDFIISCVSNKLKNYSNI